MEESGCGIFNLKKFVEKLNEALSEKDCPVSLGEPRHVEFERSATWDWFLGRELQKRIRTPLTQTGYRGCRGFLGVDSDVYLGDVVVETGLSDIRGDPDELYALLDLRFRRLVTLNHGIIPRSRIRIYSIFPEWGESSHYRRDLAVKCGGLVLTKIDLREVLPSEWFTY